MIGGEMTAPIVKVLDFSSVRFGLPPLSWVRPRVAWVKVSMSAAGTPWAMQSCFWAAEGFWAVAQGSVPPVKPCARAA